MIPRPLGHCHQSMVAKALASCSEPQPQGTHAPLRGPKVPLRGSNRLPRGLRPHQGGQGLVPQQSSGRQSFASPPGVLGPCPQLSPLAAGIPTPQAWGPRAPPPVLARRPPGLRQPPGVSGDSPLGATPQLRAPSPHRNDEGLATRLDPVTARAPPPRLGDRALAPQIGSADTGAPPLNLALRMPGPRPRLGPVAVGASPLGGEACCPGSLFVPVSALAPLPGGGRPGLCFPRGATKAPSTTREPGIQPPTCPGDSLGPAHCQLGPKS